MATTVDAIDDILPQTQCGLCGYNGCRPYAAAIAAQQAPINLCPPGGVDTLQALAKLTNQDATPYLADMQQKALPRQVAKVQEDLCIGCTKCIQVCPVDAIIGAKKQMHSIIADECTGCGLCLPPCPMDCIDLHVLSALDPIEQRHKSDHARQRFQARNQRLNLTQLPVEEPSKTITITDVQQAVLRALAKRKDNPK